MFGGHCIVFMKLNDRDVLHSDRGCTSFKEGNDFMLQFGFCQAKI